MFSKKESLLASTAMSTDNKRIRDELPGALNRLDHKKYQKLKQKLEQDFIQSEPSGSIPLTPEQQQGESIRFMDFCAQSLLDRHGNDSTIIDLWKEYKKADPTQAAKAAALLKLEKEVELHIQEITPSNTGIKAGYATAELCSQAAVLFTNKKLAGFAKGLGAATTAIDSFNKINNAAKLMRSAETFSGAMAVGGVDILGGIGMALSAASLVASLCADEPEDSGLGGLGEALTAIHSAVMAMWEDTQHNFELVFERLDVIDEKITEMERQNWKRFIAQMRAIHHYGESTRAQLNDLKTMTQGHFQHLQDGMRSYLNEITDETAITMLDTIRLEGPEETTNHLSERIPQLAYWLNKKATIKDHAGRIDAPFGQLVIDTEVLIRELQRTMAPDTIQSLSLPLGLFASLAQHIDASILQKDMLAQVINPEDWTKVLECYLSVIQLGLPTIATLETAQQDAYLDIHRKIKEKPLLILEFLSNLVDSHKLWMRLVDDYVQSAQEIQSQIHSILEKQRMELNERFDIEPNLKVICLEQSAEENRLRIDESEELKKQLMKKYNPRAFLKNKKIPADACDDQTSIPLITAVRNQYDTLTPYPEPGSTEHYLSENQVEGLLQQPAVLELVQHTSFYLASLFQLENIHISCYGSANQGNLSLHINLALKDTEKLEPFFHIELGVTSSSDWNCKMTRSYMESCENLLPGLNTIGDFYARTLWRDPFPLGLEVRAAILNSSYQLDNELRYLENTIECSVLTHIRKNAAIEIGKSIDLNKFTSARYKLLSFIKLLNPDFNVDLNKGQNNIKSLLQEVETTGAVEPLQQLLNRNFAANLLQSDLGFPVTLEPSQSELVELVNKRVKQQSLYQHRLWQTMAHAYASIEMLEQRLVQAQLMKARLGQDLIEETIDQGVSLLSEHHQQLMLGLDVIKTVIEEATPLVETGGLSAVKQLETKNQAEKFSTRFNIMAQHIDELRKTRGMDAISLQPTHQSRASTSRTLPEEQTHVLLKRWKTEKTSLLPLSFDDTIAQLEQAFQQIQSVETFNKPAVLVVGKTGAGKSALINGCLDLKFKKERKKAVLVDPSAKIYTKVGETSESETQFPVFCTNETVPFCFIDTAGFGETRGTSVEISNQMCIDWIHNRVNFLQGIIIVCRSNDIDSRDKYDRLRESFEVVGRMIQNLPQGVEKQVCVVVTDRGMTPNDIFDELNEWKSSPEFKSASALTEDKTAILRVLSQLSKESILLVDVTEENTHQPLLDKIHAMNRNPMGSYCFSSVSEDVTLMRKAVDAMVAAYELTCDEMKQLQQQLALQLQAKLDSIQWSSYLSDREALMHELNALDSGDENVRDLLILLQHQKDLTIEATTFLGTILIQFTHLSEASLSLTQDPLVVEKLVARYTECKDHVAYYQRILRISQCLDITPKMAHTKCLNWTPRMYLPQQSGGASAVELDFSNQQTNRAYNSGAF